MVANGASTVWHLKVPFAEENTRAVMPLVTIMLPEL